MAAEFLDSYGVNVDQILEDNGIPMSKSKETLPLPPPEPVHTLRNVLLASSATDEFDITIDPKEGVITKIAASPEQQRTELPYSHDCDGCLALPSLCHPHIHLDKPYLLSHPLTSHLAPKSGDFKEALSLTGEAKKCYTRDSLLERGNWLIADSVQAGVTHMRAFVEVDATVKQLCIEAGLELKRLWAERCEIQICAFAQDPMFSGEHAEKNRELMQQALKMPGVDATGSTPYVEGDDEKSRQNIDFLLSLAIENKKHLDFHLDYFLDPHRVPMAPYAMKRMVNLDWNSANPAKTAVLGHCTRLTLLPNEDWEFIAEQIKRNDLPVHFVSLPTSDIFMMARTDEGKEIEDRKRGTLQIPWLIDRLDLNAVISINNVGNAFTPQGSPDPLDLASLCVGLYQTGTAKQADRIYECISTRAKQAIGFGRSEITLRDQSKADIVVFGKPKKSTSNSLYRRRRSVQDIVYHAPTERLVVHNGRVIKT